MSFHFLYLTLGSVKNLFYISLETLEKVPIETVSERTKIKDFRKITAQRSEKEVSFKKMVGAIYYICII